MKLSEKINYGIKVLDTKLYHKKIPFFVSFLVTNKCNLRCSYCTIPYRKQKEMTTQEIFSMIDELKEIGTIKISFSGGEPLMRNDIEKILIYTKEKGIITNLVTNGLLIKDKIKALTHVDYLLISSNKEIKKDEFLENIKYAVNNNINVWIVSLIVKNSINQIGELVELSDSLGVGLLFQPLETTHSLNASDKSLVPSKKEFEEIIERIITMKKNKKNIVNSYPYLNFLLKGRNEVGNCLVGKTMCVVDVDGTVYPCVPAIGKTDGINGLQHGFKKAFHNLPKFICNGCRYSCYHESNFLFDLNLKSIINISKM